MQIQLIYGRVIYGSMGIEGWKKHEGRTLSFRFFSSLAFDTSFIGYIDTMKISQREIKINWFNLFVFSAKMPIGFVRSINFNYYFFYPATLSLWYLLSFGVYLKMCIFRFNTINNYFNKYYCIKYLPMVYGCLVCCCAR